MMNKTRSVLIQSTHGVKTRRAGLDISVLCLFWSAGLGIVMSDMKSDRSSVAVLAMACIIILMLVTIHLFFVLRDLECGAKGQYTSFWDKETKDCERL